MRFAVTIVRLLVLGLCISCGGESDLPPRPPQPDPNVVRMNGGCTDQRFLDAEWAAYQKLLQARDEAARVLKREIDNYERIYNRDKAQLNANYVSTLNQCTGNTACSEAAKADYDKWIEKAQIYHDDGIYVAQGDEQRAKERAQQAYEAEVKEAREKYCKKSYRVTGGSGGMSWSGTICDLAKPFTINGQSQLSFIFNFTPSDPTSGTVAVGGGGHGVSLGQGSGTYMVTGVDTDTPRLTLSMATFTGTHPRGSAQGSGTRFIDLAPLEGNECGN
jgi:hypothetical protein